jgi:hypothetical protein
MIPRESALFSRAWKRTSLGIVPYQGTAKASAPQTPWGVPWFVAPQGILGGIAGSQAIDFYAISWGVPRKAAWNLVETAQRKSHPLALQRHLSDMAKFARVESRLSGRKRSRTTGSYAPVNLCYRSVGFTSVAVGLEGSFYEGLFVKSFLALFIFPLYRPISSHL